MATAAHNAPPLRASRRPATTGAKATSPRRPPAAPGQARRRGPNLPRELAYLAPILRERGRIEALAAALIDLLDSFDAPLLDLEPGEDDEPDADDACLAGDDRGTFRRRISLQRGGPV